MKRDGDGLLYSISDLTEFMESPFASFMTRLELEAPDRSTPSAAPGSAGLGEMEKLLQERGDQHEREVLQKMHSSGRDIAAIATTHSLDCSIESVISPSLLVR